MKQNPFQLTPTQSCNKFQKAWEFEIKNRQIKWSVTLDKKHYKVIKIFSISGKSVLHGGFNGCGCDHGSYPLCWALKVGLCNCESENKLLTAMGDVPITDRGLPWWSRWGLDAMNRENLCRECNMCSDLLFFSFLFNQIRISNGLTNSYTSHA